jgi:hypothetical protein
MSVARVAETIDYQRPLPRVGPRPPRGFLPIIRVAATGCVVAFLCQFYAGFNVNDPRPFSWTEMVGGGVAFVLGWFALRRYQLRPAEVASAIAGLVIGLLSFAFGLLQPMIVRN